MHVTTFLGGAHYGAPFSRFGVTEAMGNCAAQHGPNGTLDLVGNLLGPNGSPLGAHDTQGWPTFVDWPRRDALTHEAMYYRRSEEHTSELQSLMRISYAVFCLKKKKNATHNLYR